MAKENTIALKPSEIKELIKQRWTNRHIKTRPLCIVGHKGIGKTDIVRQVSEELSKEFNLPVEGRTLNLQFCEPPDFLGLPIVTQDEQGKPLTVHARPQLLPTTGYGIWFFDEANRCHRDARAGMLTILQDRNVNGHAVGAGWISVLAMNPTEADGVAYEVQEFDAALEDRITRVNFRGDVNEFIQFMIARYGEKDPVVRWIMSQPDIVDFKGKTRTSPRGLDYLVAAIQASGGYKAHNFFNVVAAEVGLEAANTFNKFLTSPESISADEVLDDFSKATVDKLKLLEEQGRNDVLNTLVEGICVNIVNRSKLNPKNLENLKQYLETINAESKQAFFLAFGEKAGYDDKKIFESVVDYLINNSKKIVEFLRKSEQAKKEAKGGK